MLQKLRGNARDARIKVRQERKEASPRVFALPARRTVLSSRCLCKTQVAHFNHILPPFPFSLFLLLGLLLLHYYFIRKKLLTNISPLQVFTITLSQNLWCCSVQTRLPLSSGSPPEGSLLGMLYAIYINRCCKKKGAQGAYMGNLPKLL